MSVVAVIGNNSTAQVLPVVTGSKGVNKESQGWSTLQYSAQSKTKLHMYQSMFPPLHYQAQCMVYRALTNMLVLPWPETNDTGQQWAWRRAELVEVVAGATKVLAELQQSAQWNQESLFLEQGMEMRSGRYM